MSDNCKHCGHATCGCAAVYAQGVADERARIEAEVEKMLLDSEYAPFTLREILRRIREEKP